MHIQFSLETATIRGKFFPAKFNSYVYEAVECPKCHKMDNAGRDRELFGIMSAVV